LEDLPTSLYGTYERIFESISSTDRADARAILQWIAFAKRPLALEEVAEAATIQPGSEDLDPDDKLYDPHDVLRICQSLVSLSEGHVRICGKLEVRQIVRFAHASVREYLLSDHITQGLAASFSLSEKQSHEWISQCCLSVLLRNRWKSQFAPAPEVMPLLMYAAEFWFQHAEEWGNIDEGTVTDGDLITQDFAIQVFHTSVTVFQNWLRMYDPDIKRGSDRIHGSGPSPLYYAALLGLAESTRALLDLGYDVNALGGRYGTALVAAASRGDEKIVHLLVGERADVNYLGGIALQIAYECGHEDLVRLLLNSGAQINARAGYALEAAAAKGNYAYGSALQGAVERGSEIVTRLLLDAGADPNIQMGGSSDVLRAAAWGREQSIFDLLLERGADVELSVRRLQDGDEKIVTSDDRELFGKICAARAKDNQMLMELVDTAAKRIVRNVYEENIGKRAAEAEFAQPNRTRN